jgi:capsular polysaccharide biosynthesis protein
MSAAGVWTYGKTLLTPPYPLVSLSDTAVPGARFSAAELFPAARVHCPRPQIFPDHLRSCVPPLLAEYDFPPVTLSKLEDAKIAARTNMIRVEGAVVHHGLYKFTHDFTSEELHGRIRIYPRERTVRRYVEPEVTRRFEEAAVFTDACAPNYAHWVTEVLPRIHAYAQAGLSGSKTVIIDGGLHPNLRASAVLMVGHDASLEELEVGAAAHVAHLHVVSPAGYIPFERRSGASSGHAHGVFSPTVFASMRKRLVQVLGVASQPLPRKILLRRNSIGRSMRNEQEIEDRLLPLGFVPVYPERLTFEAQYHLFSAAEVVVGATGAAMANLIFCPPGCRVVICVSAHPDHSFGYWQSMACAVGNSVTYVLGAVTGSRAQGVHSDFSVDVDAVIAAIDH